jgi:hypothetical protein
MLNCWCISWPVGFKRLKNISVYYCMDSVSFCNISVIQQDTKYCVSCWITDKHFCYRIWCMGSRFDFVSLENIVLHIRKSCFKSSILFLTVLFMLEYLLLKRLSTLYILLTATLPFSGSNTQLLLTFQSLIKMLYKYSLFIYVATTLRKNLFSSHGTLRT